MTIWFPLLHQKKEKRRRRQREKKKVCIMSSRVQTEFPWFHCPAHTEANGFGAQDIYYTPFWLVPSFKRSSHFNFLNALLPFSGEMRESCSFGWVKLINENERVSTGPV